MTSPDCKGCEQCAETHGDQAEDAETRELLDLRADKENHRLRLDELRREIERRDELLQGSSPAAIAELVASGMDAERDRLAFERDEALTIIKDLRGHNDDLKAWTVALFAHVCRITGKNPADAPREILEIAAQWRSGKVDAAAGVEREACALLAATFRADAGRENEVAEDIAAAISARK